MELIVSSSFSSSIFFSMSETASMLAVTRAICSMIATTSASFSVARLRQTAITSWPTDIVRVTPLSSVTS